MGNAHLLLPIFILDIAADCSGLQVEHAMYLGTLQKAEIALSAG